MGTAVIEVLYAGFCHQDDVKGGVSMEITEVRVFLRESPDKKLKAYVTVTFDNVFVVRNIKVIQGSNGLFIAMPSRKVSSREAGGEMQHRDIAHPITQQFREYLQKKVLEAYQHEVAKGPAKSINDVAEIPDDLGQDR